MPTYVHTVHHSFGTQTGQILSFWTVCGNVRNCPSKSFRWNLRGTVWCIFPCTFAVYSLAVDWPCRPNLWPRGKSPSITAPVTVGSLQVDKLPTYPLPFYFRAGLSLHSLQAVVCLLQIVPRPTDQKVVTNREILGAEIICGLWHRCSGFWHLKSSKWLPGRCPQLDSALVNWIFEEHKLLVHTLKCVIPVVCIWINL